MQILITGCAGFIGAHLSRRLLLNGHTVFGVDCFTDYYDTSLKGHRLSTMLTSFGKAFQYYPHQISSLPDVECDLIIHLAGQPGVRRSSELASLHFERNIAATFQMFAMAKRLGVRKVLYASSSSVYGLDSFYACSKSACEALATGFKRDLITIGLRFFPTYGPLGRPDMAPWLFATKILRGETLHITGDGHQLRDYTYIDDTVQAIVEAMGREESCILDVGRGHLRSINELAEVIADSARKPAKIEYVSKPEEETDDLVSSVPCGRVSLEEGIPRMVASVIEWEEWKAAKES